MTDNDINQLIAGWQKGEQKSQQTLMGFAYLKIKEFALKHKARMPEDINTVIINMAPTDIANDAYLKLVQAAPNIAIETLREFYQYLNVTVRNVLMDHYRKNVLCIARNPDKTTLNSEKALKQSMAPIDQSLELEELLEKIQQLAAKFPRQAEAIELKYFAGLSNKEIARLLDVSVRTVENDIRFAKAILKTKLID